MRSFKRLCYFWSGSVVSIVQTLFAQKRRINLTISANTTNYNIYTSAGSPSDPVEVILTVNNGIYVGSSSVAAGLSTGTSWNAQSTIKIINNGFIVGGGGDGGNGGDVGGDGSNGGSGGNAINLGFNVSIDNGNGYVFGGGGGGGGGAGPISGLQGAAGGGGGGGRGYFGGAGGAGGSGGGVPAGNGGNGGQSGAGGGGAGGEDGFYPWTGGNGGGGGDWGEDGSNGDDELSATSGKYGGSGGAAGKAVDLNGKTVTWLAGNTAARVKGAVS